MSHLSGKTIAFLVAAEGIERIELTDPWQAVTDAGAKPVLLSPETGEVQTYDHLITSRNPDDLPAFNSQLLELLAHGAAAQES